MQVFGAGNGPEHIRGALVPFALTFSEVNSVTLARFVVIVLSRSHSGAYSHMDGVKQLGKLVRGDLGGDT